MTCSQKQFDTDLKEAELTAPFGVINTIFDYLGSKPIAPGAAEKVASLVPTLYNSRKQKTVRLLTAIVSGQPDEVKKSLDEDPSLVLEKLEEKDFVISPTGHKYNLKPYQAALAVEDSQMAAMIKSYFAKLNNEGEADRQYAEQYPTGWQKAEKEKWEPIFKQFQKLMLTFTKEYKYKGTHTHHYDSRGLNKVTFSGEIIGKDASDREIAEFWRLLDATLDEVITVGKKPFNSNLFIEAFKTYSEYLNRYFTGSVDERALLFWQKIIGYEGIQRFLPVNYIQALHDGLHNSIAKLQKNEPQDRSTSFTIKHYEWKQGSDDYPWRENFAFYPLQRRESLCSTGVFEKDVLRSDVDFYPQSHRDSPHFTFAVFEKDVLTYGSLSQDLSINLLSTLISIKNEKLAELAPQPLDSRCAPACVIL
ncbi:MAG: hypothetical protein ACYCQI_16065 [Gammaproteobacteria bacterium]